MGPLRPALGLVDRQPAGLDPQVAWLARQPTQTFNAEHFEQRVFEGKLGFDAARFTLAGAAAAELAVDPAGIVPLGHDDMEPAELGDARAQFDIHAAPGHVGGNRDAAALARP